MRQAQDFKDESAALFDLVSDLSDDEFDTPTAFKAWTFNHILAHLLVFNEAVCMTLDDGDEFKAWYKNFAKDTLATNQRDAEKRAAGGLSGRALCEAWRAGAENTANRFAQLDPK
ncbi:MAG: maleylpyruvate isomerase N-terminal domain-containing protein, partial [Pseudomonadota bacterium]